MYIKNNKGPNIVVYHLTHWTMMTFHHSRVTTHCFQLHRKSVIHRSKSVSILYVFILSNSEGNSSGSRAALAVAGGCREEKLNWLVGGFIFAGCWLYWNDYANVLWLGVLGVLSLSLSGRQFTSRRVCMTAGVPQGEDPTWEGTRRPWHTVTAWARLATH